MAQNKLRIKGASLTGLLLDKYPNAAVAYSLRKLRKPYTGAAIRVRRSSDNAEQDINFVGNDLDTQSLLDFVGYNLFSNSENISVGTSYTPYYLNTTGTPPYVDVETAPDGTLTGDKLIENTTTQNHYLARMPISSIVNGVDYNVSCYLKQGGRTKVNIRSNISSVSRSCDVDLTNGTISNNTFPNTPVITAEANGWYRFSVTITSGVSAVSQPLSIFLYNNSNQLTYLGDGTSGAYVWGFQLTKSSSVLTYEKTGANATKDAYITTWYDQSGNGNDATQATAASQPQIVSSGAVITTNSKNAISFPSNDQLTSVRINELHNGSDSFVLALVRSGLSSATGQAIVGTCQDYYTNIGYILRMVTNPGNIQSKIRNGTTTLVNHNISSNIYTNGNQYIITDSINADDSTAANRSTLNVNNDSNINNNIETGTPSISNSTRNLMIGGLIADTFFRGTMQEIIVYPFNQDANKAGIISNVNSYYSIY